MTHQRSVIFAAVKSVVSAIPDFGGAARVARGRHGAIPQELLPALTLTWSDTDERVTLRPCSGPNGEDGYDRELPLTLVVHLRDNDPEEEFDRLSVLIESAMGQAIKLDGHVVEALLESSRHYTDPQTGLSLCVGRLAYRIHYKTVAGNPAMPAA